MDHVEGLTPAAVAAVEALFADIEAIAHEAVRDAHPGALGPTATSRFDTPAERAAALERITAALAALAPAVPWRTAHESDFRKALSRAVDDYHRHHGDGLRARIADAEPAFIRARSATGRTAARIGTLVTYPAAVPLLAALDDVENAFARGAMAERGGASVEPLADAITTASALCAAAPEHFGTYLAHAHHYMLTLWGPALCNHTDALDALADGLDTARALLARDYTAARTAPSPVRAVALVVTPPTTEAERNARAYGNSVTRYRSLNAPSYAEFTDLHTARCAAVDVLRLHGADTKTIASARSLGLGGVIMTGDGLHILIREPNRK